MNRGVKKKVLSFVGVSPKKNKKKMDKLMKSDSEKEKNEENKKTETMNSIVEEDQTENEEKLPTENLDLLENKQKIQLERVLDDLKAKDKNNRTLLHRAALDQNVKLMEDVIKDYENIQQKDPKIDPIKKFIDERDKFGNTPLLNACSLKIQNESSRASCLTLLLQKEADVDVRNERTMWNAMHWIAYYGELDCANILLQHNISIHEPDYQGFYTIDIAGKQVSLIFYIFLINV